MEIHKSGTLILPASVLSIGAFDGVHKGHQTLLKKAKERAERNRVPFVVYTFDPPPKVYFKNGMKLTTLAEKLYLLERLGAEHVIVGSFDEAFTQQEVPIFIEEIKDLHPIEIWEGPNFYFGKGRKGNIEVLRHYFHVEVLTPVQYQGGDIISSTRIRDLLLQGQYSQAEHLLGWKLYKSDVFKRTKVLSKIL